MERRETISPLDSNPKLFSIPVELNGIDSFEAAVDYVLRTIEEALDDAVAILWEADAGVGTPTPVGTSPGLSESTVSPSESTTQFFEAAETTDTASETAYLLPTDDPPAPFKTEVSVPVGRTRLLTVRTHTADAVDGTWDALGRVGLALQAALDRLESLTDRTEQRQRLESFQRAIEEAADGVALLEDDEYVYIDQTHVELYGFDSKEDLLGSTWRQLYDSDEVARLEDEAFSTLEADGHWRGAVTGLRPDGSTFPAELSLTVVDDGRLVCTVRDETERKARERELELKERAMDEATVGIQITDPTQADNPLVYVNDAFEQLTGYTSEQALGRNPRFLQGADTDPEQTARLREAIDADEPVSVELKNYRKDGTPYWARTSVTPVTDEHGTVTNYVGIQQDVTTRKERKQEAEARVDLLERIYEVMTNPQTEFKAKITGLLEAGRDHLNLPYGFLTRIDVDDDPTAGTQTILEAIGSHEYLQPGESGPLSRSYCRQTIECDDIMTLTEAAESDLVDDVAYDTFGLETYIGGNVVVSDDVYGTLCFASSESHESSFGKFERSFVSLLGRWVGYEIERRDAREELRQQQDRLELTLSGTNTGITDWDLETDELTSDDTFVDLVGQDVETAAEYFEHVIHPDDRTRVRQTLEENLTRGDLTTTEYRVLTEDEGTRWLQSRAAPAYDDDGTLARVLAIITDISDKKAEERERRRNERRFQSLFEDPGMLVGLLDTDGTLLDVNTTAMEYVDTTTAALRGEPFWETPWWSHSEDLQSDLQEWVQRAADGEYVAYNATHRRPSGDRRHIEGTVRPVTDVDGAVTSLLVSGRDVTERKQQRRELQTRQRKLDLVLSNTGTSISEIDMLNGTVQWDELIGDNGIGSPETPSELFQTVHPDDRERVQSDLMSMSRVGESLSLEFRVIDADGETRWVAAQAVPVVDDEDNPTGRIVGIATDITNRKEREQALEDNRQRYQTLLQAAPDPIFVADAKTGEITEVNVAAEKIRGQPREELIGLDQTKLHPQDSRDQYRDAFRQSVGNPNIISELPDGTQPELQRHNGETVPVEINTATVQLPAGPVVYGVFRDISDRRERERELELKERAMDEANVGILISDPNRKDNPLVYVNDEFVDQTGYSRQEALGRNCRFLQADHNTQPAVDTLRDAIAAEEPTTVKLRNYRKNGEPFWNRLSVTPMYDDRGELVNYIGIQQDITDEERRKQALFEERERFRLLTESVDEYAFLVIDEQATIQTWNDGAENLFGYDAEAALGMPMAELHPDSDHKSGLPERLLQQARIAGESAHEGWQVRADGSKFYADVRYAPLESDDGKFRGYAKIVRDMTERRRQRRRTERFVEESEDVVTVVDPDGTITYASGSAKRKFGYDPDALVGKNLFDHLHPDGREHAMETFFSCLEASNSLTAECRLKSPAGEWFNVDVRYRNMLDDDAIDGMLVYLRDVTESKERTRRFESIFNQTFQFMGLLEPDGTVIEVNDAALSFGGFERSEIVGNLFFEAPWWTHSEAVYDDVVTAIERAASGEFVRYETEVRGGDGLATIDFSIKPVTDEDENVSLLVVEGRDITVQQQHRRHLEVMQRVVRHNMRNDLGKMRGWTEILSEESDAEKRATLFETVEQILDKWDAMTEKMTDMRRVLQSQNDDWETIESGSLIDEAVGPVRKAYDDVTILTEVSEAGSTQVPVTLIEAVRELVDNAAGSSDSATVEVELTRPEDDWIEVDVRDDGPGIPEMEADVLETGEETPLNHGQGLGLWMVRMIVTQAGGEVMAESTTDGTAVRLRLPTIQRVGTGTTVETAD